MEPWQEVAAQQFRLLTSRLNELLSQGLGLLRSELGVDLGLKPDLIPPWAILLAACSGLVLMVALWASLCHAVCRKRPAVSPVDVGTEAQRGVGKPVKCEEPKKKKRKTDKKSQFNGSAVAEPQEGAIASGGRVPHQQPPPSEVEPEKVGEGKRSKKKLKQALKENKTANGKEPEEGTWETKVSNKEKREQRKKDKSSSDGSASPGGADTPESTPPPPPEQPKVPAAPAASSQKKKKGESTKAKPEKFETVIPQVNNSEVATATAARTNLVVKAPADTLLTKTDTWASSREPWSGDIDEPWTMIETGMTASLSGRSAEPVRDLPWLTQPRVDDEWSGLNGGSADPSSDWNAPSEVWGNYEEPTAVPPPARETTKARLIGAADDDDDEEKDKGDGASKAKKKKKKKKKAAEEAAGQGEEPQKETAPGASVTKRLPVQEIPAAVQPAKAAFVETRVAQPVKDNISQKPPVTQAPQKPTDVKPEESQAPKPAKKKKARRET
ncbi:protein LYRIC-like [Brachionichthys hirsutus]|uniref:protein LYRIC-like n=1 Tax=Brachionichthys hirsutus TaxID=412623 RepID=UPI003604E7B0